MGKILKMAKWLTIVIAFFCIGISIFSLDGCIGAVWTCFGLHDETVYASGYSDMGFRRVRKGLTEQKVLQSIGPPLSIVDEKCSATFTRVHPNKPEASYAITNIAKRVCWNYSMTTNDGSYAIRQIIFSNGKVISKIHEYYVD